jgi:di/tripeptidase
VCSVLSPKARPTTVWTWHIPARTLIRPNGNIGIVQIGDARNKVSGHAELKAELRSFDAQKAAAAAKAIKAAFTAGAKHHDVKATVDVFVQGDAYFLDEQSPLLRRVKNTLGSMDLEPVFESTYGCFDGNVFAANGMDVVIQGAAYYNPHSPTEYVKVSELDQFFEFVKRFTAGK